MSIISLTTPNREIALIHPKTREILMPLLHELARGYESGATQRRFQLFEGFRDPRRQDYLFKKGTTKARAWQSAHNYGLAVDIVPFEGTTDRGFWRWGIPRGDWEYLHTIARNHGFLTPINWDLAHLEHPIWSSVSKNLIA